MTIGAMWRADGVRDGTRAGGSISFSAARELTRVAIPSTEREWLEAARNRTVRDVEQLVSGHRPGSRPDDAPSAEAKRHVLRFEVSGETLATFREAMAKIRREAGESLDEDAALLLLSRHVLAAVRDEGRSSYQVALTVCESCRRGTQQGRGELVQVSPEAVEMTECDGQHVGHVHQVVPGAHVGALNRLTRAKQSILPAKRRQVPPRTVQSSRGFRGVGSGIISATDALRRSAPSGGSRRVDLRLAPVRDHAGADAAVSDANAAAPRRPMPLRPRDRGAGAWRAPRARRPQAEHAGTYGDAPTWGHLITNGAESARDDRGAVIREDAAHAAACADFEDLGGEGAALVFVIEDDARDAP